MKLQFHRDDAFLLLVKLVHPDSLDLLGHQVRGAIILEASVEFREGDIRLLRKQIEARAFVKDAPRIK